MKSEIIYKPGKNHKIMDHYREQSSKEHSAKKNISNLLNRHKPAFIAVSVFIINFTCVMSFAAEIDRIELSPSGTLCIDKSIKAFVLHFNNIWRHSSANKTTLKSVKKTDTGISGIFQLSSTSEFLFKEKLERVKQGDYNLNIEVSSKKAVSTNLLSLSISFPVSTYSGKNIVVDGKKITFPSKFTNASVLDTAKVKNIIFNSDNGPVELSGALCASIRDQRKYGSNNYSLRLLFSPWEGEITSSKLSVNIKTKFYDASPIDISSAANMSFSDKTAGDGEGGWTDQGPKNDLSMLKNGKKLFGGIPFEIINSHNNHGKSCIVLAGSDRKVFPSSARVKVNYPASRYLFLLHATAWTSLDVNAGTMTVYYKDGSHEKIRIKNWEKTACRKKRKKKTF